MLLCSAVVNRFHSNQHEVVTTTHAMNLWADVSVIERPVYGKPAVRNKIRTVRSLSDTSPSQKVPVKDFWWAKFFGPANSAQSTEMRVCFLLMRAYLPREMFCNGSTTSESISTKALSQGQRSSAAAPKISLAKTSPRGGEMANIQVRVLSSSTVSDGNNHASRWSDALFN